MTSLRLRKCKICKLLLLIQLLLKISLKMEHYETKGVNTETLIVVPMVEEDWVVPCLPLLQVRVEVWDAKVVVLGEVLGVFDEV